MINDNECAGRMMAKQQAIIGYHFSFSFFFLKGGKKTSKLFQDFQLLFFFTPGVILMTKEKQRA